MDIEQNSIHVNVKWNKDTLSLEISSSEDLESLRVAIYSLTQVLPEKQKLLFKGKFLKEGNLPLKSFGIGEVI
jgi:hypothetical protein